MEDIISVYIKEIEESDDFIRLKELKKQIDKEYSLLIVSFKNKEAKYLEAKDRPEIFDLKKAQEELVTSKTNLFSKPLVKEYFELEQKINEKLKEDMSELTESISHHFQKSLF